VLSALGCDKLSASQQHSCCAAMATGGSRILTDGLPVEKQPDGPLEEKKGRLAGEIEVGEVWVPPERNPSRKYQKSNGQPLGPPVAVLDFFLLAAD